MNVIGGIYVFGDTSKFWGNRSVFTVVKMDPETKALPQATIMYLNSESFKKIPLKEFKTANQILNKFSFEEAQYRVYEGKVVRLRKIKFIKNELLAEYVHVSDGTSVYLDENDIYESGFITDEIKLNLKFIDDYHSRINAKSRLEAINIATFDIEKSDRINRWLTDGYYFPEAEVRLVEDGVNRRKYSVTHKESEATSYVIVESHGDKFIINFIDKDGKEMLSTLESDFTDKGNSLLEKMNGVVSLLED